VELLDQGKEVEGPVMLGILTVGPSVAGGFFLSPQASPVDGYLDFCYVDPVGLAKVARYVPRVLKGTHLHIPEFHHERVRRIRLSRPDGEPFFFELDGELMPERTTMLDVEIKPEALAVLVPGEGGAS
jgi:diacylglycerol kinase (ATP)